MNGTRRITAFGLSILAHVAGISFLVWFDHEYGTYERESAKYVVIPFPHDLRAKDKVIWFKRPPPLPEVSPEHPFGPAPTPQGHKDNSERVLIVRSPNPVSDRQLIRQPDAPEPLPKDVPAPNLIVVHNEGAQPLPKPVPKTFVRPPDQVQQQKVANVAEPPPAPVTAPVVSQNILGAAMVAAPKLPPKAFVLPPRASGTGTAQGLPSASAVPAPPGMDAPANSAPGAQAIMLGLDPSGNLPPRGSRSGQFAVAPTAGIASSGAAVPGAPTAAGVVSHGGPGILPPPPVSGSRLPGFEGRTLREVTSPPVNRTMSAPLRPSSRVIPANVEAIFSKRDVYTLVIPKPNLPDYLGDWILWFGERRTDIAPASRVSAPIPTRKYTWTDPGASPKGVLTTGSIQVVAVIDKNGRVTTARVLKSAASPAFQKRAMEELETWEFTPALRNGEPMNVDAVLEFRLQIPLDAEGAK